MCEDELRVMCEGIASRNLFPMKRTVFCHHIRYELTNPGDSTRAIWCIAPFGICIPYIYGNSKYFKIFKTGVLVDMVYSPDTEVHRLGSGGEVIVCRNLRS